MAHLTQQLDNTAKVPKAFWSNGQWVEEEQTQWANMKQRPKRLEYQIDLDIFKRYKKNVYKHL